MFVRVCPSNVKMYILSFLAAHSKEGVADIVVFFSFFFVGVVDLAIVGLFFFFVRLFCQYRFPYYYYYPDYNLLL